MDTREHLAKEFLNRAGWGMAARNKLAGDASNRRYDRLRADATGATAVLMDAPPDKGEDVRPFVRIARHLSALGLSAPDILAADETNGFLLLEDLGDDLFARVIPEQPDMEQDLYVAATDLLLSLHRAELPDVPAYDALTMTGLSGLVYSKYAAGMTGRATEAEEARFALLFRPMLDATEAARPVLVLRDYHAENLLWLPDRDGIARVGLLDFQDAMRGHPAYDLVSLLQDARRDVPPEIEEAMIARYVAGSGEDDDAFRAAYAVLGAQRNLRILGVFARLGLDHGRAHYIDLIPRVWNLMLRDLDHPALEPVAGFLRETLPAPDPEGLNRLRPA